MLNMRMMPIESNIVKWRLMELGRGATCWDCVKKDMKSFSLC